jgi:DNA-directed RNA polymerase specialized sigma subunit
MPLVPLPMNETAQKRFSDNDVVIPSLPQRPSELASNSPQPAAQPVAKPADLDTAYQAWRQQPSRENMSSVVAAATPYISKATQRHVQSTDAVAMGHAKSLFIRSLPKYDPNMASLPTFIDRQLQPMIRWQAGRQATLQLPERVRTDAARMFHAEQEYRDEYGRAPSTRELAEYSGLSSRRIAKLRKSQTQTHVGSSPMGEADGEELDAFADAPVYNDEAANKSWLDLIKNDFNDIDQFIMERTLGLDGAPVLSNKDIARELNITPGAVSQRKARIQSVIDRQSELGVFK